MRGDQPAKPRRLIRGFDLELQGHFVIVAIGNDQLFVCSIKIPAQAELERGTLGD